MGNGRPLTLVSTLGAAGLFVSEIPCGSSKATMAIPYDTVEGKFQGVALDFF
jgi:hypothetical protein